VIVWASKEEKNAGDGDDTEKRTGASSDIPSPAGTPGNGSNGPRTVSLHFKDGQTPLPVPATTGEGRMERFSDIVRFREKKQMDKDSSRSRNKDKDLWFREFDVRKVEGDQPSPTSEASEASGEEPNARRAYERLRERARETRKRVREDQDLDAAGILSDLEYVLENHLLEDLFEYAMMSPEDPGQILSQILDVTIVALKLGAGLGYGKQELLDLGLAAFLENIGMYKIPESIIEKRGRLDEREMALMREHPILSAKILSRLGEPFQWVSDVALQVHERADGSGYPKGLKGEEIGEPASIIGLADTYVAMIKRRPHRDKFLRADAVKLILKEGKTLFPEKVLKVFLEHISLFPLNTLVRLNNDFIARVIATDPGQPLRPTLELLQDGRNAPLRDRKVIRLADHPELSILEAVDESVLAGH